MPEAEGRQHKEIEAALTAWLDAERARFASAAATLGLPPGVWVTVPVGSHDGKGGVEGRNEARSVSLTATYTPPALLEAVQPVFTSEARVIATEIQRSFGDSVFAFSPLTFPRYADDPLGWIETGLLGYARDEYLSHLESLDAPNEALGAEVVVELMDFIRRSEVDLVTVLPIQDLQPAEDPCSYGAVTLRNLTPEELGLQMSWNHLGFSLRRKMARQWDFPVIHTAAIEVREPGDKKNQVMGKGLIHRVVLALQLLGFEPSGRGQATTYTHPGPTVGFGGQPIRLPAHGEAKPCSAADLERAVKLAAKIGDDVFTNPAKQPSVSLHRFHLGSAGDSPADAVIDFCIALEGLLLQQQEAELSYRFRLLGAHYLSPDDPSARREIYKQLRELYRARSTLVHGGTPSSVQELQDLATRARALAARALLKALSDGWPTQSALTDAPLG